MSGGALADWPRFAFRGRAYRMRLPYDQSATYGALRLRLLSLRADASPAELLAFLEDAAAFLCQVAEPVGWRRVLPRRGNPFLAATIADIRSLLALCARAQTVNRVQSL